MAVSAGDEFWEVVESLSGESLLPEVVRSMARCLAGVEGVSLAVACLQAVGTAIGERCAPGELLVLEAEQIARTLPLAYAESLEIDCNPHRLNNYPTPRSPAGPLTEGWIERLSAPMPDMDRVAASTKVIVTILDDLFVKTVNDLARLDDELDAIVIGLLKFEE